MTGRRTSQKVTAFANASTELSNLIAEAGVEPVIAIIADAAGCPPGTPLPEADWIDAWYATRSTDNTMVVWMLTDNRLIRCETDGGTNTLTVLLPLTRLARVAVTTTAATHTALLELDADRVTALSETVNNQPLTRMVPTNYTLSEPLDSPMVAQLTAFIRALGVALR